MLLKDRGIRATQAEIITVTGNPATLGNLARVMNEFDSDISRRWLGGNLVLPGASESQMFEALNTTGSWAAMFWESGANLGHLVVVDGQDSDGYVLIRDPWQSTRYKMKWDDFLLYWNEHGVFQRKL